MIFKHKPPYEPKLGDYYTRFALFPVQMQNKNAVWLEKYYIVKAKEYINDCDYMYYERWHKVSQSDFLEFREEQMKEDIPTYSELRMGGRLISIVQNKRSNK